MVINNLSKKIKNLEQIYEDLRNTLDIDYLISQGIIGEDIDKFFNSIGDLKLRIKSEKITDEEILNLSKNLDDIKQFLLSKFYHYI